MRHLVTGGAGFVGSHLVERLLDRGDHVTVLDDLSGGRLENLPGAHDRLDVRIGSVLDASLVDGIVAHADRVWHLAAIVGVPRVLARPRAAIAVNARGAETVLDACAAHAVPVVLFSSSEVYGDGARGPLSERDPLQPGPADRLRGSYAAAKALAEWTALALAREQGLAVATVRLFNVVGPRQRASHGMVLPRFSEQALRGGPLTVHGDGRQRRCFADVRDVTRDLVRLGDHAAAFGATFNVGSDRETSVLDLAELVRDLAATGAEIVHVPYERAFPAGECDVRRRVPCLDALRALGIGTPPRPLEDTASAVLASRRARLPRVGAG